MIRPRRFLSLSLLLLAFAAPARGQEREDEEGPRLILEGSHAVRPGQEIALAWTAADEVSELEILLSLDGGRTYPLWISPRLSPRDRRFVWRVPDDAGRNLRMRIRFNRGGREIEGPPTASLDVVPAGVAEPLGLPPLASHPGSAPRPDAQQATSRACAWAAGAVVVGRPRGTSRPPSPRTALLPSTPRSRPGAASPRFVPLRA